MPKNFLLASDFLFLITVDRFFFLLPRFCLGSYFCNWSVFVFYHLLYYFSGPTWVHCLQLLNFLVWKQHDLHCFYSLFLLPLGLLKDHSLFFPHWEYIEEALDLSPGRVLGLKDALIRLRNPLDLPSAPYYDSSSYTDQKWSVGPVPRWALLLHLGPAGMEYSHYIYKGVFSGRLLDPGW